MMRRPSVRGYLVAMARRDMATVNDFTVSRPLMATIFLAAFAEIVTLGTALAVGGRPGLAMAIVALCAWLIWFAVMRYAVYSKRADLVEGRARRTT
jgi:hypothetical protein